MLAISISRLGACLLVLGQVAAQAATVTVTLNDDSSNTCRNSGLPPCSLRDAVTYANGTAAVDTIAFNIGTGGRQTVGLQHALQLQRNGVAIDGRTQPGFAGLPLVEVISPPGANSSGLRITGDGVSVRALSIGGFNGLGLTIEGSHNQVLGNHLGVDGSGTVARGNRINLGIVSGGNNQIGGPTAAERNLISAATHTHGLTVQGVGGNRIEGNYIGTDGSGAAGLGNYYSGVQIESGSDNNVLVGNLISANNMSGAGQSGAVNPGLAIAENSRGNRIENNRIGTDASGTVALGSHGAAGVSIYGDDTLVLGNLISGNERVGVLIANGSGNVLRNNRIGTDEAGTQALPNGNGVMLGQNSNTMVAEGTWIEGNTISGNSAGGISLQPGSSHTTIRDNRIGSSADGSAPLPNDHGIVLWDRANDAGIGGVDPADANTIAWNRRWGVALYRQPLSGVQILGNHIFGNGRAGIEYNSGDQTNNGQVAPVLQASSASALVDELHSRPDTRYRIEYFSTPAPAGADLGNPGGMPNLFQGQYLQAVKEVQTDATGKAQWPRQLTIPSGHLLTATATEIASRETSRFSLPVAATNNPPQAHAQALQVVQGGSVSVTLGASDAEGDPLLFILDSQPAHGRIGGFDATTGRLVYTADADYAGPDSFRFRANDGQDVSLPATVSVEVTKADHPSPGDSLHAYGQHIQAVQGQSFAVSLHGADDKGGAFHFELLSQPRHGQLACFDPVTGELFYVADAGYLGDDSFRFRVRSGSQESPEATVTITVVAAGAGAPQPVPALGGGALFMLTMALAGWAMQRRQR